MAFFSIICPVYNSQNTLERTINSVLNQSFEDWELILIDDGSTDESALLCDNYLKHNNIKVIHQSNQGPLLAREAGIKIATGEFLLFLDDDDTFELNALNIIHNKLAESNADVLIYKRKRVYPDKPTEVLKPEQIRTNYLLTNVKEIIKHCYVDNIFNYLTEKCFKKSLYKRIEIPEKLKCSRYEEDTLISYLVIKDAKRVMFVKDILYTQHANENSITHNLNVYDYKMCYEIYKFIYQDMIDIGINITNYSFFNNVFVNYLIQNNISNKKELKAIKKYPLVSESIKHIQGTKIQRIVLRLLKNNQYWLIKKAIAYYRKRIVSKTYKELDIYGLHEIYRSRIKMLHDFLMKHNIKYYAVAGTCLGAVREQKCIDWDDDADFAMLRTDYEKFLKIVPSLNNEYLFVENYRFSKKTNHAITRVKFKGVIDPRLHLTKHLTKNFHIDIFPMDYVSASSETNEHIYKKIKRKLNYLRFKTISRSSSGNIIKTILLYGAKLLLLFYPVKAICKSIDTTAMNIPNKSSNIVWISSGVYSFKKECHNIKTLGDPQLINFYDYQICAPEQTREFLKNVYGDSYLTPIKRSDDILLTRAILTKEYVRK